MDGSTLEGIIYFLVGDGIGVQSVFVLALTIAIGLAIGQIKFWKLSLGVSGVLFSSLLLGNSGVELDQDILLFTRDFGLILFIFSVGLQVGPGFTDSLRQGGLALNALSAGIVAAGFALVLLFAFWFGSSPAALIGLFSGGTTSTPALAAATQTAGELVDKEELALVNLDLGLGYALAYPFGVIGVIIAMLLIRVIGRIDIANEMKSLEEILHRRHSAMHIRNLKLTNANLIGKHLSSIPGLEDMGVTISRVMDDGHVYPADPEMELKEGMIVHVVGDAEQLDRAELIIGPPVASKLRASHGHLEIRSLLVTNSRAIGSTLRALQLTPEHGVTVTRIRRSGMELAPRRNMPLHFGDKLVCVGSRHHMDHAERLLGNSTKMFNMPNVLPIFVGIALGVLVGSIPFAIPGLSTGFRLGLAGGPLLVAILLSRVQHFAGMTWYLPTSAAVLLRETGICLFLACVGLNAGQGFWSAVFSETGLIWLGMGACITLFPLLLIGWIARRFLGLNYVTLCGLLVGSMTSAPTLAFAVDMLDSDVPSSVYATVYPLATILRIFAAQGLVLLFYL